MLSMTTDYAVDTGYPELYLRRIAEAGFSHIHWCHQWNTDFLYSDHEINQIAEWLKDYGLKLNDLHASEGIEKAWGSPLEYEGLSGVELVKNRIAMTARLSSDVIIMHLPATLEDNPEKDIFWSRILKSLDVLEPFAKNRGIRIAIENTLEKYTFATIGKVLSKYGPDYLGLCYDSGHGNIDSNGLEYVERLKDRLIAIHIHDNDGVTDQHKIPLTGTVDWTRLARIIAESSYTKCVSLETTIRNTGISTLTIRNRYKKQVNFLSCV